MATDVKLVTAVAADAHVTAVHRRPSRHLPLRISCWAVALALGAWQAWATRFAMNPDGVSYLDIGDAYWRGDWHNAINAYWSPLYSWILGFFVKVVKPSIYWEYPLVHFVNFLIYAAAVACFELFLSSFVSQQEEHNRELQARLEMGLSPNLWFLLGYALFIWTSLVMVGLQVISPDMLVLLFVCVDCALVVRIQRNASKRNFLVLGVALGSGYLAKSILFPVGSIFLATAAFSVKKYRHALAGAATFLIMAAPFIGAISYRMHRLTFGESGRITYAAYISNLQPWFPGDGGDFYADGIGHAENIEKISTFSKELLHPVRRIFDQPATYSFDGPISGTYPFWYDVSYWQDGIRPFFQLSRELQVIKYSLIYLLMLTCGIFYQLVVTVTFLLLLVLAPSPSECFRSAAKCWYLLVPVVVGSLMYAAVHFEYRYVAPLVCIGWITLFSGIRLPSSNGFRLLTRVLIPVVAFSQVGFAVNNVFQKLSNQDIQPPAYVEAAQVLQREGFAVGSQIAIISDQPWGEGGPFTARLARLRIVAQVNSPAEFWNASPSIQSRVLEEFAAVGVDAVLIRGQHQLSKDWQRLGKTPYSIRRLRQ